MRTGRPQIKPEERKEKIIPVRVSISDFERIKKFLDGRPVSRYFNKIILDHIQEKEAA